MRNIRKTHLNGLLWKANVNVDTEKYTASFAKQRSYGKPK